MGIVTTSKVQKLSGECKKSSASGLNTHANLVPRVFFVHTIHGHFSACAKAICLGADQFIAGVQIFHGLHEMKYFSLEVFFLAKIYV